MIVKYKRRTKDGLLIFKEETIKTDDSIERWIKMISEIDIYENDCIYIYYNNHNNKVKRVLMIPKNNNNYVVEYLHEYQGCKNLKYLKFERAVL